MNCVLLVWTFVALASLGVNEDIPYECRPVNQGTCTSNSQCTPSGVAFCMDKLTGSGKECRIPCFREKEDPKENPSLETTPKNVTDGESFTITCARDAGYQLEILKSGSSGTQSIAFINKAVGFGQPGDCLKGVLRIKDTRITINGSAPNRLTLSYTRAQKSDAGQYICCARWNIGGVGGGASGKMMLTVQANKKNLSSEHAASKIPGAKSECTTNEGQLLRSCMTSFVGSLISTINACSKISTFCGQFNTAVQCVNRQDASAQCRSIAITEGNLILKQSGVDCTIGQFVTSCPNADPINTGGGAGKKPESKATGVDDADNHIAEDTIKAKDADDSSKRLDDSSKGKDSVSGNLWLILGIIAAVIVVVIALVTIVVVVKRGKRPNNSSTPTAGAKQARNQAGSLGDSSVVSQHATDQPEQLTVSSTSIASSMASQDASTASGSVAFKSDRDSPEQTADASQT